MGSCGRGGGGGGGTPTAHSVKGEVREEKGGLAKRLHPDGKTQLYFPQRRVCMGEDGRAGPGGDRCVEWNLGGSSPFLCVSIASPGRGGEGKGRREGGAGRGKAEGRQRRSPPPPRPPPPGSSCSRTNCSVPFTAGAEQKSGYLLEYLFGIVPCHTKAFHYVGVGRKAPLFFFSFFFSLSFFLFSPERNNN